MHKIHKLTSLSLFFIFLLIAVLFYSENISATGISIDAGLTPAANRIMFRTQMRYMERDNKLISMSRDMKMYMFPVVVAYGLRPDWTVMVRQAFMRSEMTMMGQTTTNSDLGDLLLLSKYRLTRINKPNYTFGIAPTLGLEIPTGQDNFTSNSYDLRFGSYFSGRLRSLGMDLNITYIWNGMALTNDTNTDPGDEFAVEAAMAYQLSFGSDANFSVAPVLESSYQKISSDSENGITVANTGESVFLLSPGIKITRASFIFESLIQFPVWQDQNGLQMERGASLLIGIRLMN